MGANLCSNCEETCCHTDNIKNPTEVTYEVLEKKVSKEKTTDRMDFRATMEITQTEINAFMSNNNKFVVQHNSFSKEEDKSNLLQASFTEKKDSYYPVTIDEANKLATVVEKTISEKGPFNVKFLYEEIMGNQDEGA